ncbi:MAG TPA: hypothetical protein VK053_02435 [Jiangellaceae bacterium]|nr:hypothetical protein [Jiangellaceae bacterium]
MEVEQSMRLTPRISTALLAGVAVFAMSACGSDDDADTTEDTAAETEETEAPADDSETAPTDEQPTEEPGGGASEEPEPDASEDLGGTPGPEGGTEGSVEVTEEYCNTVMDSQEELQTLSEISSPENMDMESAETAASTFTSIADSADGQLAESWQAVADVMTAFVDAEGDVNQIDPNELDQQALTEAQGVIQDSVMQCGDVMQ